MNRKECYDKIKSFIKTEEGKSFFGNYQNKSTASLITLIEAWEIRDNTEFPTLEEAVVDTIEYLFNENIIDNELYDIDDVIDIVMENVFYDEEPVNPETEAAIAYYEYIKELICGIKK
jgi:hypothetical protein